MPKPKSMFRRVRRASWDSQTGPKRLQNDKHQKPFLEKVWHAKVGAFFGAPAAYFAPVAAYIMKSQVSARGIGGSGAAPAGGGKGGNVI